MRAENVRTMLIARASGFDICHKLSNPTVVVCSTPMPKGTVTNDTLIVTAIVCTKARFTGAGCPQLQRTTQTERASSNQIPRLQDVRRRSARGCLSELKPSRSRSTVWRSLEVDSVPVDAFLASTRATRRHPPAIAAPIPTV